MKRAAAVATAAALLAVAACTSDSGPRPDTPQSPSSSGTGSKTGADLRGITLPSWYRSDYDSPAADRYLRGIRATGARWITLTPTWYQRGRTDATMRPTEESASDASLRHITRRAHTLGLKVMIKPHVDLTGGGDRAGIRPRDRRAWFAAYRHFIGHYAELATDIRAEQFAVGTELAGVSGDRAAWHTVIEAVHDHYDGPLTYAANYDEYQKIHFWKELDLIGIDAYWPLSDRPTRSLTRLRRAWAPIREDLAAYAHEQGRRILFTEAGYVSQQGATTAPYSWTVSRVPAPAEQAAAYRALLDSFDGQSWWAGVCWWMWDDWPDSGETPERLAYSPRGKPAEEVLRQKWSG